MNHDDTDLGDIIDFQLQQQGTASFSVKDGQVFVFTTATLESLLAAAMASGEGKAIVFVRQGVTA